MSVNRETRKALWAKDPHCYYCGRKTTMFTPTDKESKTEDMATVDHKFYIRHPFRSSKLYQEYTRQKGAYVLACNMCNNVKGILEVRKYQPNHAVRNLKQKHCRLRIALILQKMEEFEHDKSEFEKSAGVFQSRRRQFLIFENLLGG